MLECPSTAVLMLALLKMSYEPASDSHLFNNVMDVLALRWAWSTMSLSCHSLDTWYVPVTGMDMDSLVVVSIIALNGRPPFGLSVGSFHLEFGVTG